VGGCENSTSPSHSLSSPSLLLFRLLFLLLCLFLFPLLHFLLFLSISRPSPAPWSPLSFPPPHEEGEEKGRRRGGEGEEKKGKRRGREGEEKGKRRGREGEEGKMGRGEK
jgi:hypothetical protein